jgi:hypothetical protein
VCEVLFNGQDVSAAVKLLMSRDARPESH